MKNNIVKCKDCIHSKKHVSIIRDDGNIKHYYRLCKLRYPKTGFKDDDYCDCGVKKNKRDDDMLIEDLGLSKGVYKYLKRAGINYIEELENMTDKELQKIRNIGQISCYEIRDKIDKYKKNNDDLIDVDDDECCDEDVYKGMDGKWYLKIRTNEWSNWDDCFVEETVQINYCPFCGRKLE